MRRRSGCDVPRDDLRFGIRFLDLRKRFENILGMSVCGIQHEEIGARIQKRARTVTPADYDRFDRIIVMDRSNLRWIQRIFGADPDRKIHMMMSYCGLSRDVADPWYTGDFEQTFQDILSACEAMLNLS